MKLFIRHCPSCNNKVYLDLKVNTKGELRSTLGGEKFHIVCNHCKSKFIRNVNDVIAETDSQSSIAGGFVGGILGLIGGPIGLLVGGGLGAILGSVSDEDEKKKAIFFNHSI